MKKIGEEEIHLRDYWQVISKRRVLVLSFFFMVVGMVAVFTFTAESVYQSSTSLMLEKENPTITFTSDVGYFKIKHADQLFKTHKEIMETRAFADRVVRKLQLENHSYILKKKEKSKIALATLIKGWLNEAVKNLLPKPSKSFSENPGFEYIQELDPNLTSMVLLKTDIKHTKGSDIFQISYESDDPRFAAFMANGIAFAYIEHNLDIRVKPFKNAVEWLSAKMVELRGDVEDSERRLQEYRETKGIVSFEARENIITQKLKELISQMVRTEGKKQEAEVRYKQIKSVINKPDLLAAVPDIMNNRVIQNLRIDELMVQKKISELSKMYGSKHPVMIKTVSELKMLKKSLILEARKMLNSAKMELEISRSREVSLKRAIEKQKQEVLDLSKKAIEFNVVSGEAQINKRFYSLLLNKLQEASLSSGISVSNVQVVDPAVVPERPIKPRKKLNLLLAIIVGLFGGMGMAFFVEYMDDTIKTQEDVERMLELPFLSIIPSSKEKGPVYMATSPESASAEVYRTLRTAIIFSSLDKPSRVFLVTSSTPNEGKSTTCANLAVVMAQMGEKVLLIDSDLRRPSLHKFFKLENKTGISNIVAGSDNLPDAFKKIPDIPNLTVLPAGGSSVANAQGLLGSNRMKELLVDFGKKYDRIILDSPPVMAFSDPLILSRYTDSVILVVWGGMTRGDIVKKGVQSLQGVKAKILGVVLNNLSMTKRSHYQYYYPYYSDYYVSEKGKEEKV